ncbi:MAG: hypothetical protein GWO78_07815 [Dehalococcoidales bacterium]|nr:hypothetical protein [Dehalococcoidales bacterium]
MGKSIKIILAMMMVAMFALTVACGGDDDSSSDSSSSSSAASASSSSASAPSGGASEVKIAVSRLHPGIGTPQFCTAGCAENLYLASVQETLFRPEYGDNMGMKPEAPVLATSWTLADDLSYLEFELKEGVMFHGDWGEMTADDVVFSFNNANSATNPESVHGQAGDFAPLIKNLEAIDKYTVRMNYANYDSRGIRHRFSTFWQTAGVVPKKAFDDLGADGMRDVLAATGPYEVESWVDSDKAITHAVENHHRVQPSIDTVIWQQVAEASTRRAMLETGESVIVLPALKDWKELEAKGFVRSTGTGNVIQRSIALTGNYWEAERYYDQKPLERECHDKAWVGCPGDAESMENARLVRQALAHAIDREGLVDSVMDGFGGPIYFAYSPSTENPNFKKGPYVDCDTPGCDIGGWEIPYDMDYAKSLLEKAGHGDGFKMENVWTGPPGAPTELMTAIAGSWKAAMGIDVTLNNAVYSTYRPGLVARSTSEPFVGCGDDSNYAFPWDWARGFVMSSWSDGGYGVGMEAGFAADNYAKVAKSADKDERIGLNNKFADEGYRQALCVGIVLEPVTVMYSPDVVAEWEPLPNGNGNLNGINNIESLVVK